MRKLLFVLGDGVYPYRTGGMEIFNFYLIRALKDSFEILVLGKPIDIDGVKSRRLLKLRPEKVFVPLQLLLFLITHPAVKKVVFSFAEAHWLVWWLYALFVKLVRCEAVVVIHHGGVVPKGHFRAYRFFFQAMKKVIAVSDEIKRNYDGAYGIKCEVIYPLVPFRKPTDDKSFFRKQFGIPEDANVVTMVGSLKPLKNPQTLLEAIARMDTGERALFRPFAVFAGGGPMMKDLKKQAEELGIDDFVKFLGIVPKENVADVLVMSDIYLIASDSEGTSVSLLEAMYNEVPIISADAPGLSDMLHDKEDCLMFGVRDSGQLKNCMMNILSNPSEATRRVGNAKSLYCKKYDYQNMIKSYLRILS